MSNFKYRIEEGEARIPISELNRLNDEFERLEKEREKLKKERSEFERDRQKEGYIQVKIDERAMLYEGFTRDVTIQFMYEGNVKTYMTNYYEDIVDKRIDDARESLVKMLSKMRRSELENWIRDHKS